MARGFSEEECRNGEARSGVGGRRISAAWLLGLTVVALVRDSQIAAKLIEAVNAPLGFFVLALLIVESFLAAALLGGGFDASIQVTVLWMGVVLFVFVTLTVAVLVWKKPENLTFDKQAHLDRSKAEYGTDLQTVTDRDALFQTESNRTNR